MQASCAGPAVVKKDSKQSNLKLATACMGIREQILPPAAFPGGVLRDRALPAQPAYLWVQQLSVHITCTAPLGSPWAHRKAWQYSKM